MVLAVGHFEGEPPWLVVEEVKVGANCGATGGFGQEVSASEAEDTAKVAALSSKLHDSLLLCFLP